MVVLRELRVSDAEYMCEYLKDKEIATSFLYTRYPFEKENFIEFIKNSWKNKTDIHYAISDEHDNYIGTISLKNINYIDRHAEYAIVTRKEYWGKEYAKQATDLILDYGFKRLNLHKIYLNVLSSNIRANRFYEKYGFIRENTFSKHIYVNGKYEDLNWFCMFSEK